MLNYLQGSATDLSELTTSLRDLLNEEVHFQLKAAHEQSFTTIKKMISEAPVLKFFYPKASFEIQCNASDSRGLSVCLLEEE